MYIIAAMGDIFGAIPIVNFFTDPITAIALGIAGSATGVRLYSEDKLIGTLIAAGIKAIPGVSFVPAWTIRVYLAKRAARLEKEAAGEAEA